MDNLKECMSEIISDIKEENIIEFIEEMKMQNCIQGEKLVERFFPCFKKTEDLLKHVQHNKYNRNIENELKETRNHSLTYNDDMIKYMKEAKQKLLLIIHNNEKLKNEKNSIK